MEGKQLNIPQPSFDEGRELINSNSGPIKKVPENIEQNVEKEEKKEKKEKGIFGNFVAAAKDFGKNASKKVKQAGVVIATGTSEAGKYVAEKTSTAATTVWEKGKSITVTLLFFIKVA